MQITLAFLGTFLSLDKMITSTGTSLLASTNREIAQNVNYRFERMIKLGNLISVNDNFRSYSRTDSTLPGDKKVETELMLGQMLSGYTSLDTFCDVTLVYSDGTTLGQVDAYTQQQFNGKELYTYFADLSDRDSDNFRIGKGGDRTRLYYSKAINTDCILLVSILREELDSIFYDAEENFNLTLHMSTADHQIIYSGDDKENSSGALDTDLAQAVENSNHLSMQLRGNIIASDTCTNGWRITSTIPEDTLTAENGSLQTIYLIMSIAIIVLGIVLITLLCLHIKKYTATIQQLENSDGDYSDLNSLN